MGHGELFKDVLAQWSPPSLMRMVRSAAGFPFNTEDVQIHRIKMMFL